MPTGSPGEDRTRLLVLGGSGMLGHALMYELSGRPNLEVTGTIRSRESVPTSMLRTFAGNLESGVDVGDDGQRAELLDRLAPDVVVNAVGVIKQDPLLDDEVSTVRINALLPHQVATECEARGVRFIQVSTDCVFSGRQGGYSEEDIPDPVDFYGRSKLLGEVHQPALTLRTSIVGHELKRHHSLVDWFLSQSGIVQGFARAVYSGVTTVEFARFLADVVVPRPDLAGLYHVASEPITKHDLLALVAGTYGWTGRLERYDGYTCDRSLNAARLREATGYQPPDWSAMVSEMHDARLRWARQDEEGHRALT